MANAYTLEQNVPVSALGVGSRATFINRTYTHLLGAILAFTGIEAMLLQNENAVAWARTMSQNWLIVLGAFMVASWVATRVAFTSRSQGAQYAALAGFVVAEAVIFLPMLVVATRVPGVIQSAALVTILGFAGLSAIAFLSRKDFSFLGSLLKWAGLMALVGIVASIIFGFQLGTWFAVAMISLAGGAILHDTSNILHRYPEDRYVGAALQLFASVALMFWYVISLFLSRD